MKKENVKNVEKNLLQINTAQENIVRVVKVKSVKKVGKADVYNIEVQKYHNFIANGIIVHNSIDASRYLIKSWKDSNRVPIVWEEV